jgi:hypothetical protein
VPSHHTGKYSQMRTPSTKTKSPPFTLVIAETLKLWRKHHLTYDQTRYIAKEVRRALAIARPPTRQRVIARLSRTEEERLVLKGRAKAIVVATGAKTKLSQLGHSLIEIQSKATPLQDDLEKLGRPARGSSRPRAAPAAGRGAEAPWAVEKAL